MTSIEWTRNADGSAGESWNYLAGCSVISPGCTNCYAMRQAARIARMSPDLAHYRGLTQPSKAGPVWTGIVAEAGFDKLIAPIRRRKPQTYFVNSMSDLFHESVPDEWIDRVFAVMALSPQHTYQLLTKRADRMRAYYTDAGVTHRVAQAMDKILVDRDDDGYEKWAPVPDFPKYEVSTRGRVRRDDIVLKQQINPEYGRPSVTLWRDAIPTTVFVHILVLRAWRGPMPDGCETRHRNGERTDNRLINLEWASGSINQQDKVRHGSNGGPAKLTREQAAEIRSAVAAGETQQSIADRYGVSRSLVSLVKDRKVWPDAIEWPLRNVWKGVSAEDQTRADARVPDLLATPAAVRFVSAEPLLGPIDFREIGGRDGDGFNAFDDGADDGVRAEPVLDWIIVGGESGPSARPMHPAWARAIRDQCAAAGVAFFFKQWGEFAPDDDAPGAHTAMRRVGKARAGRILDGRTHDDTPQRSA